MSSLLGGGLVDGVEGGGVLDEGVRLGAEGFEVGGLGEGFLPGAGAEDAFFEKVVGEKLAGHWLRVCGGGLGFWGSLLARGLLCQFRGNGHPQGGPYGLSVENIFLSAEDAEERGEHLF